MFIVIGSNLIISKLYKNLINRYVNIYSKPNEVKSQRITYDEGLFGLCELLNSIGSILKTDNLNITVFSSDKKRVRFA